MTRHFNAVILCVLLTSCRSTYFDSCSHLRQFKQFDFKPDLYLALPPVDVGSLPQSVHDSVAAQLKEPFIIRDARRSGPYILLTVSPPCFDCDRWFVYSTERQCIVGRFVLGVQG